MSATTSSGSRTSDAALKATLAGLFAADAPSRWSVPVLFLSSVVSPCAADPEPLPWLPTTNATISKTVPRSVEITRHDEPLYPHPAGGKQLRGAARLGARLPLFGATTAAGCLGRWLLVGASAWVCEEQVRLSSWPADEAGVAPAFGDGLPYRYSFVGEDGSFGYAALHSAEDGVPAAQFEPGFSVAALRTEPKPATGELYTQTTHALWVPTRDLRPANPSQFEGVEIDAGHLDAAWIFGEDAPLHAEPHGKRTGTSIPPLTRIHVEEEIAKWGKAFVRVSEGWLEAARVRRATPRAAPQGLLPDERWIDVDTARQTLVAYEGERPVFATLVSTGRGNAGSAEATPIGEHRIWVKLSSTDMTNLEDDAAGDYYAIEDVPWVMFFKDGYGLHGAFWHRSFGSKRSHGCVNLAPRDAQRLFRWASPRMPSGWHAVHPGPHDLGTRVVVR